MIKPLAFLSLSLLLCSCQLGYIAKSAYWQADLMRRRVPLQYALDNYELNPDEKEKIELAIKLRKFMKSELKLDTDSNYSRYVQLDQKYVTYAVNASPKDQLKTYRWSFPVIGSVPYKGYFKKQGAVDEARKLEEENLDTHVRGVSAYSTLGWFEDPLLSSMLRMKEHHFVNTLIHETVHANLYIKGQSKFNERVASFLGQLGAEAWYKKLGRDSELAGLVQKETHDELKFSSFITSEIKALRSWYKDQKDNPNLIAEREIKFEEMKQKFKKEVEPQLKTDNYKWFSSKKLNNAFLLLLELYNSDFKVLEKLANHHQRDFQSVLTELKKLEDSENPEEDLEIIVANLEKKSSNNKK